MFTITMSKQKSAHSLKSTTFAHFSYQIFERISSDGLHIFYNEFFLFTCCYFFCPFFFLRCLYILSLAHIILQARTDAQQHMTITDRAEIKYNWRS